MFKINLTGADETVRLSEDAGIVCAPRDLETLSEIMASAKGEDDDKLSMNELAKLLAAEVVHDWYGLVDEDGAEIDFDPELVAAVMSDPIVLQAFREQYLTRLLYVRDEGNGSTPSQNGTSGAARTTAKGARSTARRAPTQPKGRKAAKGATSGG